MTSMIALRDTLALQGRMEASQLSRALHAPQPMVNAMLLRLEAMGKVRRVIDDQQACLMGSCKNCPSGKKCLSEVWILNQE